MDIASQNSLARPRFAPWITLLAVILGLALYFSAVDNPMLAGARALTLDNPQVTEPFSPATVWLQATPPGGEAYRPVLATLLRVQYFIWQESPSSFHSMSILFYLLALAAFMALLGELGLGRIAQATGALVMAAHPMMSQAVHTIAGQGILLSLAAMLAALVCALLHRRGRWSLALAGPLLALCALVAIGSHEIGLLLPAWIALMLTLPPVDAGSAAAHRIAARPARNTARSDAAAASDSAEPAAPARRDWLMLVPPMAVAALILILRFLVVDEVQARSFFDTGLALDGQDNRLLMGPAFLLAYVARLLWPIAPTLIYNPLYQPDLLPAWPLGAAVLVGWMLLIGLAWHRARLIAVGLALTLTALLPIIHWVPMPEFMSEALLPPAVTALALLAALMVHTVAARTGSPDPAWGTRRGRIAAAVLIAAGLALVAQTHSRGREWKDPTTLWTAEAERHPESPLPLLALMNEYVDQQNAGRVLDLAPAAQALAVGPDLDRAIRYEALMLAYLDRKDTLGELLAREAATTRTLSTTHLDRLAALAYMQGMPESAEALWRRELERDPEAFEPAYELARILHERGDSEQALRLARRAADLASETMRPRALSRLGEIMAETGQPQEALTVLGRAIELDETLYRPYIQVIRILWGMKAYERADRVIDACVRNTRVATYSDLVELRTGMLEDQDRLKESLQWVESMTTRFPTDVPLQFYAARYHLAHGSYEVARRLYRNLLAVVRDQRLADALTGLGMVAAYGERDFEAAMEFWRRARQVDETHAESARLMRQFQDRVEQP